MIKLKDLLNEMYGGVARKPLSNKKEHVLNAGKALGKILRQTLSKRDFEVVISDELKHAKEEHGFDSNGPNSEYFRVGVAQAIWNQPTHPNSIPAQWKSLPWKTKENIFVYDYSPVELSRGELNKKEATAWIESIAANKKYGGEDWKVWETSPLLWITRYVKLGTYSPRSKLIADWIVYQDKTSKGIFSKEITQHLPDGREVKFKYTDILDEIQDGDLTAGVKTNVTRAFSRANERTQLSYLTNNAHIKFADFPWTLLPEMEYLDTPKKLADEGKKMDHCVGGYAPLAIRGEVFIVSIQTTAGRSTVEVDKVGNIRQHKGKFNAPPPNKNKDILDRWMHTRNEI
jgi:hypothetical protein